MFCEASRLWVPPPRPRPRPPPPTRAPYRGPCSSLVCVRRLRRTPYAKDGCGHVFKAPVQAVGNWLFALRERMGRMHDTGKRAGICWPRTTTRSRVRGGKRGKERPVSGTLPVPGPRCALALLVCCFLPVRARCLIASGRPTAEWKDRWSQELAWPWHDCGTRGVWGNGCTGLQSVWVRPHESHGAHG